VPSAKRSWTSSSGAHLVLGAVIGLLLLALPGPAGQGARADVVRLAPVPGLNPGIAAGLQPLTLEYHPGEFGDLRQEVIFKQIFRGVRKVVRGIGRVGKEVLKGTVKGAGEAAKAAAKVAQVPGKVGQKAGREVGGFFGGMLGGRRGRRVGKKLGGLYGEVWGGNVAGRSSLIRAVNRAGGRAEHIREIAQKWSDRRDRIEKIFKGDIGGLAREEIERRMPGMIQEIRPELPTNRPVLPPTPPPPPMHIEGPH
jgi:hypothetical protein